MALASYAMATVAEFKRYARLKGPGAEDEIEEALRLASMDIEGEGLGGRRGIYRGPVESYTGIVNAQAIAAASGNLTIAAPPNSAGRTIVIRKNDADRGIQEGTVTITQASPALSETFDLAAGDELHGVKFFTAVVTGTFAGVKGYGTGDTIDVGTSAGYTELWSPSGSACEIKPEGWPLWYVAQLWEDYDRVFGADTLLVEGTDFELRNVGGIGRAIARLSGSIDAAWPAGRRIVKARLSAGWKGTAGVPQTVKGVCLELAAWYFKHQNGQQWGLSSQSDGFGNRSFSGPPMLTEGMKARLGTEFRAELSPVSERDWSEAA